jgi:aldose 1-epimerase
LQLSYEIAPDGLTVTTTARNIGSQALPFASGQHPYLATPTGLVDACTLEAPGTTFLPTDDRGIPSGRERVDRTDYDFRSERRIKDVKLDVAFGDLKRDGRGRAWVRLRGADRGGAAIWVDGGYRYVELFTGDSLPDADRRRRGLGVEPMTAPPNAFESGVDLQRLEPGQSTSARWGVQSIR